MHTLHHVILETKLNVLLICVHSAMLGVQLDFGYLISLPIPFPDC